MNFAHIDTLILSYNMCICLGPFFVVVVVVLSTCKSWNELVFLWILEKLRWVIFIIRIKVIGKVLLKLNEEINMSD